MNTRENYGGESVRLGQRLIELRETNRLDRIIVANSIYPPESHQAELGDDLPYTTGQIWAACGVLAVVMPAIVFGCAWMGVQ